MDVRLRWHIPIPQDRGGVLYVPVDVLASMKKGSFLLNGTKIKPIEFGDGLAG